MGRRFVHWLLWFYVVAPMDAREVIVLQWPTRFACQPPKWDKPLADWMPAFRLGLATLPEAATVGLALSQPALMGLPADAAAKLQPLVAHRYELIAADSAFAKMPSALPYCFSAETPTTGMATLYVPDHASSKSRSIVFLHGYGGSFLWYLHYLAEVFPDDLILAPAYGISAGLIPVEYVMESTRAMEKRMGFPVGKPRIIGLSAGGFGASRVFANRPEAFSTLELIAAYPPEDAVARLRRGGRLDAIAGAMEVFVGDDTWGRAQRELASRGVSANFSTIPGADHFFMLTHPTETISWLRSRQ